MGVTGIVGTTPLVGTTVGFAPLLWLIACAAIIISYTRKPAPGASTGTSTRSASAEAGPAAATQGDRQ
jgi:hypothetical protein